MENIDTIGADPAHLSLIKKTVQLLKDKYGFDLITEPNIAKEITIFFTDAKLSDKIYYFFPKNILQINQKNIFYIIDCYLDYGYTAGAHGLKDNGASKQIWGYAKTKDNIDNLLIRPITKMDKQISRFFSSGIKIGINKEFDNKYYVASGQSNAVNYLNKEFIDLAAKCNNLYVVIRKNQLLIGFLEKSVSSDQVLYLCKLLNSMTFLRTTTQ